MPRKVDQLVFALFISYGLRTINQNCEIFKQKNKSFIKIETQYSNLIG